MDISEKSEKGKSIEHMTWKNALRAFVTMIILMVPLSLASMLVTYLPLLFLGEATEHSDGFRFYAFVVYVIAGFLGYAGSIKLVYFRDQ
jgi:hypothetical protein